MKFYTNNFIFKIIKKNIFLNKNIITRFAPEPNGVLHLGHIKAIYLNYSIANYFKGKFILRFDDTNPDNEYIKYIKYIKYDLKWLGFNINNITYTSNYFNYHYLLAYRLIKKGLAYIDELSIEELSKNKGNYIKYGKNSPYRNRSIKENLKIFLKMYKGCYLEGKYILRAKINMKSSYIILRDPVLYRIKYSFHFKTRNKWCIYPMYDFSHCISDSLEKIIYSLCTLEFQSNRILYNWILNKLKLKFKSKQYEYSKLNLEYNILSKRQIKFLIKKNILSNWNDPRLATISGLRKIGYTSKSILNFCKNININKKKEILKLDNLKKYLKEDLNNNTWRIMGIIHPLNIIIINLPFKYKENIWIFNHPKNKYMGIRPIIFSKKIYIDKFDFKEKNIINFKRLILGKKIKLRNSYIIKALSVKRNIFNQIITIYCKYYPFSLGVNVNNLGIIHWVSAFCYLNSNFNLYNKLFKVNNPYDYSSKNILKIINKNSLIKKKGFIEYICIIFNVNDKIQLERVGYFCFELIELKNIILNRTILLN